MKSLALGLFDKVNNRSLVSPISFSVYDQFITGINKLCRLDMYMYTMLVFLYGLYIANSFVVKESPCTHSSEAVGEPT